MIWKKKKDASAEAAETAEAKSGVSAFAKKNWKWLVPVVVVAAAGAVFLIGGGRNGAASRDVTYAETTPVRQDVSNSLSGTGTLNPANTYTVKSLVDGKILTGGFEEGDKVEEGDVLYTIDSSDASTNLEKASIALQQAQRSYDKTVDRQYVRAEVDGTVSSLKVAKGDEVTSGQEVAVIRDSSKMLLNLLFPAADAANFSVGQSADVVLDGTFETLKGTITAVTGTDELSTGNLLVRTVTIRVNNAGGLTTAQAATASINGVSSIASATFAYQAERTLTALASGTVSAINVQEGDAVSKGDILIELTGDDLTESIQSASESLRSAEISMQNQQDNMSNYTITSPISGTIIEKDAKQGDALTSGSTLCVIYDLSYLEMTLSIDELDISTVEVGQAVQITADAVEGKTFTGTVTKVSVAGTTSGGITSYPVTVRIDEADELLPGMNVDAEIVLEEAADTLAIPSSAVTRGSGNTSLVLVTQDSPSAANAVEQEAPEGYAYVQVETGISDDSYVQILSGLQEGDTAAYVARSTESGSMMMGGMPGAMGGDMPAGMPSGMGGAPGGGMPSGGPGGGFPG